MTTTDPDHVTELQEILTRVSALGPNGDAKLIGALSVLAPTVLLMAIERLEAHEAARQAERMTRHHAERGTRDSQAAMVAAQAKAVRKIKTADNQLSPPPRARGGETLICPEYGSTCSFELEVSEVDPDASLSEMMSHFRNRHRASLDQAYAMLRTATVVR